MKKCVLLLALVSVGAFATTYSMPVKGPADDKNYWSSPNKNNPYVIQINAVQYLNVGISVSANDPVGVKTDGVNITCNNTPTPVPAGGYLLCQTNQNITILDNGAGSPSGAQGYFTVQSSKKK